MNSSPTIAVTGLHRGENPQPGSAVIRSLRRVYPELRIIGLCYDTLESGLYSEEDAPDAAFTLPYPSAGLEAFWDRLDAIREIERFDVLIPCLDAEMAPLVNRPKNCANAAFRPVCRRGRRLRLATNRSYRTSASARIAARRKRSR